MSRRQESFQEQIERFYCRKMTSNEYLQIGYPSHSLLTFGVKDLPIIMKQSTLSKCMRKTRGSKSGHNLSKELIAKIPEIIENPALIVDELDRGSYAFISDEYDTDHHPLLLAIHLEQQIHGKDIHEITSFYGRERLGEYLRKKENVFIWDIKKPNICLVFSGYNYPRRGQILTLQIL